MTSLTHLFNEGLIRREYKRQMELAFEEYERRKKLYEDRCKKRTAKWTDKQKEKI